VMRHMFGYMPSRMNPQLCNMCEQFVQKYNGGAEVDLTILFADVRGSTTLAEGMNPKEFSRLINRFYKTVSKIIFSSGGMVEKLIGDAVTGFFVPGMAGADHARTAVDVAKKILQETGHHDPGGPWVPVGIGIHTGLAYVGAVTSDQNATDIAVLGDTPNIGARLAAQASPGEIHISQSAAIAAGLDSTGIEIRRQSLKGRVEPIDVWVLAH
jgi:adenylate cyclase